VIKSSAERALVLALVIRHQPGTVGLAVTLPAPKLPTGIRSALVIATGAYASPRLGVLRAPARDAADVSSVLSDPLLGGFTVTELLDGGVHELRLGVDGFLGGPLRG
jgi:hypothetical protein